MGEEDIVENIKKVTNTGNPQDQHAENGANGIHDGTPFYEIGDHKLKAESSWQFDGTLGINSKDITAELTGFVNNINHYIFSEKLASLLGGDSIRNDPALALAPGPAFKYVQ